MSQSVAPYEVAAERQASIAEANDPLLVTPCPRTCFYGECSAPRSYEGCGGCCGCLGGCRAQYEMASLAPYVWEGDQA